MPEPTFGSTSNFLTRKCKGLYIAGFFLENCIQLAVMQSVMSARIMSLRQEM